MSAWDTYANRIEVHGTTKRGATLKREVRLLQNRVPDSLSYQTVTVYSAEYGYNVLSPEMGAKSFTQKVSIANSDNLNEKYLFTIPGEDMELGSLIYWMDNYWLVHERDANTTVYTRTKLIQCNYLLKWVSYDNTICEQWCVVEDGTKYLTGELEDRYFATTRGDSRISVEIAKNSRTVKLGRTNRFLIDNPESPVVLAYALTKPLKFTGVYNNQGVFKFVLQEVNTTDDDNQELCIADYYKYFPLVPDDPDGSVGDDTGSDSGDNSGSDSGNDSGSDSGSESGSGTGRTVWL